MSSVCAGGNESEGILCDGGDVVIGGGDYELVIGGDAVEGVFGPATTSKEVLEKMDKRGMMKGRKVDQEKNGGGDSGNNVVKKGGDLIDYFIIRRTFITNSLLN